MILECHQGGASLVRGFFTDEANLRLGFLCRPTIGDTPNPGSPRNNKDTAWHQKLAKLFGNNCRIVYVPGNHDGGINVFDGSNQIDSSTIIDQPVPLITALKGDAIVIDYAKIPSSTLPFVAVIKTCDCGQWILKNRPLGRIALIHVSVATGVQYGTSNTQGPIIERVMHQIGATGTVHSAFGCSINGLKDHSHRCYPWDKPDADKLSQAIRQTAPNLSQADLFRDYPDQKEKVDVDFGQLQLRLAEQAGLAPPWQLDTSHNHCTCLPSHYSMRYAQGAEHNPLISDHNRKILEAEASHRYGNLAFVYIGSTFTYKKE